MGGHRGKDIAAVEGAAYRHAKQLPVGDFHYCGTAGSESHGEQAVVWSKKNLTVSPRGNSAPRASHAGVDHGNMNGSWRECKCRLGQGIGTGGDLEGRNFVADIDDYGLWANAQNHAFHGRNVVVLSAKVCEQSDERAFHGWIQGRLELVPHAYFDHNATSPVAPDVLRELVLDLGEVYGNASSIHYFGQAARQRLEAARRQVAALLGCDAREIVFTSGGTEADNLAIFGTVRAAAGEPKHVITSRIEHPAVLNTCMQLEREGVAMTWLGVGRAGVVDPDDVRRALRPQTVLVSVMHANNETGVVQPVEEIAAIGREAGVTVHTDAVQSTGRTTFNARALGVDLLSLSGH